MKIYLYNPDTGYYLGEDFADEAPGAARGRIIPRDATPIAPPRVERGHIPVYNCSEKRWEIAAVGAITGTTAALGE